MEEMTQKKKTKHTAGVKKKRKTEVGGGEGERGADDLEISANEIIEGTDSEKRNGEEERGTNIEETSNIPG